MRIDISYRHCKVSGVLCAYIARRLQFALSRVEPRIIRVAVFLTDLNGPHDGPDKQCRMVATLHHGRTVVVADIDRDLRVAIDHTALLILPLPGRKSDNEYAGSHRLPAAAINPNALKIIVMTPSLVATRG